MDKSWSVIKFPDENAVEAVPTTWLCGNNCFWPPWSKDRINTAIKSCKPPDVVTWHSYPFTPLRNNIFDDYESARKKMEKATFLSDLESHVDSNSDAGHRKKRRSVKTTVTRFSSFEMSANESDDVDSDQCSTVLPRPPKYRGIEKKKADMMISRTENDKDKNLATTVVLTPAYFENENHSKNNEVIPAEIRASVSSGCNHIADLQQITGFLKQIIRKQNIIQSTLSDLGEDITEIKSKIAQTNAFPLDETESIFTILHLPVDSPADLQHLEDYLNQDMQMNSVVKKVATSGGKNVYELVYRATQKLITNRFASNYSYFGRQKKSKFCTLKLNELLKKAAIKVFPNCSEKEAEVAIAKWLRRCTERAKKEQIE